MSVTVAMQEVRTHAQAKNCKRQRAAHLRIRVPAAHGKQKFYTRRNTFNLLHREMNVTNNNLKADGKVYDGAGWSVHSEPHPVRSLLKWLKYAKNPPASQPPIQSHRWYSVVEGIGALRMFSFASCNRQLSRCSRRVKMFMTSLSFFLVHCTTMRFFVNVHRHSPLTNGCGVPLHEVT